MGLGISMSGIKCRETLSATSFDVLGNANKYATLAVNAVILGSSTNRMSFGGIITALTGSFLYSPAGAVLIGVFVPAKMCALWTERSGDLLRGAGMAGAKKCLLGFIAGLTVWTLACSTELIFSYSSDSIFDVLHSNQTVPSSHANLSHAIDAGAPLSNASHAIEQSTAFAVAPPYILPHSIV